ncbi:hypothetical protein B0H66DRAFT_17539 [Apodospora peruviana]|uniref:Uncharacterized protein n=1 Tax=Apodospora peruviana TaxID=516989 RepID=A0AAE0IQD6_9PEZI|nr:hypothetical protein B0H66DRAFT_17539 [Apodospora peruviana]
MTWPELITAQAAFSPAAESSDIDPISYRIRIYRHAGTGTGPGRSYATPEWTKARVENLKSLSPILKSHINELRAGPDNVLWEIEPEAEDGVDRDTALEVLKMLGRGSGWIGETASEVSRYASGLWFFEVIPDKFPACQSWKVRDAASGQILGSQTFPPANHGLLPDGWCWNHHITHSRETCLQLANGALILGWDELFKKEIKVVIWDWSGEPGLTPFGTPVKRLKAGGLEGLNDRRKQEKDRVIEHMHRYLAWKNNTNKAEVERIVKALKDREMELHEPDNFQQESIYEMLRDIELAVLPRRRVTSMPLSSPSNQQNPESNTSPSHRPSGLSGRRGSWLLDKIKEVESKAESKYSGEDAHKKFVRGFLDDTHKFVIDRQKKVAKAMMAWRDDEIGTWKKRLR